MIFWNYDNITISQFERLVKDPKKVKRVKFWLPEKWVAKKAFKLIEDYNEDNNEKEQKSKIYEAYHKVSLANRVGNALPAIYHGLLTCKKLYALTGELPAEVDDFAEMYKELTGRPVTLDSLDSIVNVIEKLSDRLENFDKKPDENFDFSEYLNKIELLLHPRAIRNERLKDLKNISKQAVQIAKIKRHGRD